MAKKIIFFVEEAPEGGYTARSMGHGIFTEADNLSQLKTMVKDAVDCHFDIPEKPSIIRLHIVKEEVIPA
jgi:hypothetical protein